MAEIRTELSLGLTFIRFNIIVNGPGSIFFSVLICILDGEEYFLRP